MLITLAEICFVNQVDSLDRCDGPNGRRARAMQIGRRMEWKVVDSTTVHELQISLRYSATTDCVWAAMTSAPGRAETWLDQSWDGGKSWQPRLVLRRFSNGSYTGTYPLAGGVVRACGKVAEFPEVQCTNWYRPPA
jgi:hypothetical protein